MSDDPLLCWFLTESPVNIGLEKLSEHVKVTQGERKNTPCGFPWCTQYTCTVESDEKNYQVHF